MEELRVKRGNVYKIAFYANRKTAKRHIFKSFQAETPEEAIERFKESLKVLPKDKKYELWKGNWSECLAKSYESEDK